MKGNKIELKTPCRECPLITELLISENTPQIASVQEFLSALVDSEYSLSCHKFTDLSIAAGQTEDPPLCRGAINLRDLITKGNVAKRRKTMNQSFF